MMRKWNGLLALMLCAGVALAGNKEGGVSSQIEASMLVKGTIEVDAQGQVAHYTLANEASLPPPLLAIVDRRIRAWRFQPLLLDGYPARVNSPMQVRLVTKRDGEKFLFRIAGATFGTSHAADEVPTPNGSLAKPRYPEYAYTSNVGGTVYLVVRIGRDGSVEDAMPEQVNLRSLGSEREMARFREILADSSIAVSRKWKFNYPTRGEWASAPFVSARVAIEFLALDMPSERTGKWMTYVPGPRQIVPWRDRDAAYQGPDAIAIDGVYPDDPKALRLLEGVDG